MKPWENPYFEEDYENPDCDCYGCATMRHECWYDYIERRKKEKEENNDKKKLKLNLLKNNLWQLAKLFITILMI